MSFLLHIIFGDWLTILLILTVLYIYIQWVRLSKGPVGLPYIGYYPFLSGNLHLQLEELAKKYGEAFCFTITGQTYVHLRSVRAVREAQVTKFHCFSERPKSFSLFSDAFGNGVGFTSGEEWKVLRKFFVQLLKEYGMGKKIVDDLLGENLQKTVDILKATQGKNFDAPATFTVGCTEVIRGLLFSGAKIDDDDIRFLIDSYEAIMKCMVGKNMLLAGPLLKYILLYLIPKFRRYREYKHKMESVYLKIIREHEKSFDKDNVRNVVDCYINERKVLEEQGDPKAEMFSEKALAFTLVQFIGDGAMSTGYLVAAILKELSHRPEIQKEIQREVDEIVGRNRLPSWNDKNRMPYTNAAICESLRICTFLTAFPSMQCTKATTICGCHVPKGAITLVNFWAALHDPEVYDEPHKYDPTRFLPTEDKKTKNEWPITFGLGRRSCIGEPLVNMEAFLFVTSVLQSFEISPPEEHETGSSTKKEDGTDFDIFLRATARASY